MSKNIVGALSGTPLFTNHVSRRQVTTPVIDFKQYAFTPPFFQQRHFSASKKVENGKKLSEEKKREKLLEIDELTTALRDQVFLEAKCREVVQRVEQLEEKVLRQEKQLESLQGMQREQNKSRDLLEKELSEELEKVKQESSKELLKQKEDLERTKRFLMPNTYGLTKEIVNQLLRFGYIEGGPLKIDDSLFSDEGLVFLKQFVTRLTALEVVGYTGFQGFCRITENTVLPFVEKSLKNFSSRGSFVLTDEGMHQLKKRAPYLEQLFIGEHSCITDKGLEGVSALKELKVLSLTGQKVTDAGLMKVAQGCPDLRRLLLEECSLSDVALKEFLQNCKRLHSIDLVDCPEITNEGILNAIEDLKKFKWIAIKRNHKITAKAIDAILENCPHLSYLHIENCSKVSERAKKRIAALRLTTV